MKIFLVGTAFPMRGGIAQYVALLFQQFKEQGHEVKIISFKRQYPAFLFPGKTQQDTSQETIDLPSQPLIDSINPFTWLKTFFLIKREKPDLVIYKYWMPFFAPCYGMIVLLSKLFTKTKSVYIGDNIVPHEKIPVIDDLLTKWGLWCVDYFIVQSVSVRQDLLHYKPKAVFKEIPHPVFEIFKESYTQAQAREKLGIQPNEKVLLFFGFIRAYKGLNHLITALPKVLEKMKVRLLICGEFYDDEHKYRQQIADLNVADQIILKADYIPNEEVGLYYAATDVVVLPYVTATQSGVVQVAYNYNKPVITTRVGGLPEVIDEDKTGFIVPPQDPDALAAAIIKFFEIMESTDFAQHIQEHKKQYSWERMAGAITGFLKNDFLPD
jgi:glycosyltransferase involved in cell wall biosynthesis